MPFGADTAADGTLEARRKTPLPIVVKRSCQGFYEARIGRKVVARVSAWTDLDGDFTVFKAYVHKAFRRRGVATAIYAQIESDHGKLLKPKLTNEDAFQFWTAYRPEAVADDLRHRRGALIGKKIVKKGRVCTVVSVGSGVLTVRYDDATESANSQSCIHRRDMQQFGLAA